MQCKPTNTHQTSKEAGDEKKRVVKYVYVNAYLYVDEMHCHIERLEYTIF